jgi:hypothetical protein
MKRLEIELGSKYGKLTIVEEVEGVVRPNNRIRRKLLCLCDCGNQKVISLDSLRTNHTISCGCVNKEINSKLKTTHGLYKTEGYYSWYNMKQRCTNPNRKCYKDYGGRGIKVCDRWDSFENFIKDMGERPKGYSIDRINSDGNYEPSNCRWADRDTQIKNRKNYKKNAK